MGTTNFLTPDAYVGGPWCAQLLIGKTSANPPTSGFQRGQSPDWLLMSTSGANNGDTVMINGQAYTALANAPWYLAVSQAA
jgi:hypothetical protein